MTFADLVDACIVWQVSDVQQFVSAFCDRRGIPAAFYEAFSPREFAPLVTAPL